MYGAFGPCNLKFQQYTSTTAVFFGIEKAFDIPWHVGFLYKLSTLQFSISLIKLISSFLSQRQFRVSVEVEISTPRDRQEEVPQGSVLSPTLYNLYINYMPQTPGVYLRLFADDTYIYMKHTAKSVLFSESCSEVSVLLRRGVRAGT
jgi:hypothetical protein